MLDQTTTNLGVVKIFVSGWKLKEALNVCVSVCVLILQDVHERSECHRHTSNRIHFKRFHRNMVCVVGWDGVEYYLAWKWVNASYRKGIQL